MMAKSNDKNIDECIFSLKSDRYSFTMSFPLDSDVEEVRLRIKYFLLSCGFHPDSVKEIIGDDDADC